MNQTIPLNKLILSPRNVRKTNGDEDIESLADSIASKGLLQNLVVSESIEHPAKYEVDAGGRRLRALQLLASQKRVAKNMPVPVQVIPRDDAIEASLAENLQKVAMNPADEVEAFHTIVYEGANALSAINNVATRIANCARRFGRTERYVEQRLRLAALAPDILEALREYRIGIEAARAYASHPDHQVQMVVFKAQEAKAKTQPKWAHRPVSIRDALAGKSYPLDHRLVRYIGLDAYVAAGGKTERDLFFGDEDRELLIDTALVRKLAAEKALQEAQALAQDGGWLDAAVAPVDGPYWSTPKTPDGFKECWESDPADIPLADKISSIAIYRLNQDGTGVEMTKYWFKPVQPVEPGQADNSPPAIGRDWEAERRAGLVRLLAARLAAPKVAGSALEGRAFWPGNDRRWVDVIQEHDDKIFVALMIQVDPADIEERLAEAEAEHEAFLQAAELPDEPETDDDASDGNDAEQEEHGTYVIDTADQTAPSSEEPVA
jgi:ParB family chromosome partitioning protein